MGDLKAGGDSKKVDPPSNPFSDDYNDVSPNVYGPEYNAVGVQKDRPADSTSGTTAGTELFRDSFPPPPSDGRVVIPADAQVIVDGKQIPNDGKTTVVIENAHTVIINGRGDVPQQVVRFEDNGDQIGANYPERFRGPGRIGNEGFYEEGGRNTYHDMVRRRGPGNVVISAQLGGADRDDHGFRHSHRFDPNDRHQFGPPEFYRRNQRAPQMSVGFGNEDFGFSVTLGGGGRNGGVRFYARNPGNGGFDCGLPQPGFNFGISSRGGSEFAYSPQPQSEVFHHRNENSRISQQQRAFEERCRIANKHPSRR